MSNGDYSVDRPKGKVLGYVAVVEPQRTVPGALQSHVPTHLPPATNYETLISEGRANGFSVACVGHVTDEEAVLLVAMHRVGRWEVFIGAHHRLERISIDSNTSFDFGGGMFLSGRDQDGKPVSLMIPDYNQDNLGLVPTFNGARVRSF